LINTLKFEYIIDLFG